MVHKFYGVDTREHPEICHFLILGEHHYRNKKNCKKTTDLLVRKHVTGKEKRYCSKMGQNKLDTFLLKHSGLITANKILLQSILANFNKSICNTPSPQVKKMFLTK